jgi:glycine oxidase
METVGSSPQVLVIGAGIIGLACARELTHRGLRVDVVDAGTRGSASPASAGLLAPVSEGAERLALARLCVDSAKMWPEWADQLEQQSDVRVGLELCGALAPALDPGDHEHLDRLEQTARTLEEPCERVDGATLRREVPELTPAVESALLLPRESRVDPRAVLVALARSLDALNVPVHRGRSIHRLHPVRGGIRVEGSGWGMTVPTVVVASGAWTSRVDGLQDLPIRPVKGQVISLDPPRWRWRGTLRARSCYTLFRPSGRLLVGATMEEAGFDSSTTEAARDELLREARRFFPSLRTSPVCDQWAGLRPAPKDDFPIIGYRMGTEILVATGHHRNGILLAPWTAACVADAVLGTAPPPGPLSPERFTR